MSESSHWLSSLVHSRLHMSACIIFALCRQAKNAAGVPLALFTVFFICGHMAFEKLSTLPFLHIYTYIYLISSFPLCLTPGRKQLSSYFGGQTANTELYSAVCPRMSR